MLLQGTILVTAVQSRRCVRTCTCHMLQEGGGIRARLMPGVVAGPGPSVPFLLQVRRQPQLDVPSVGLGNTRNLARQLRQCSRSCAQGFRCRTMPLPQAGPAICMISHRTTCCHSARGLEPRGPGCRFTSSNDVHFPRIQKACISHLPPGRWPPTLLMHQIREQSVMHRYSADDRRHTNMHDRRSAVL